MAIASSNQSHRLQKLSIFNVTQHRQLFQFLLTLCPILSQVELISCISSCNQLENGERNATCIHFFKHLTHSFSRCVLTKQDDWHLVLLERLNYLLKEISPAGKALLHFGGIEMVVCIIPVEQPWIIEHKLQRENFSRTLFFSG